ncbi:4'-phosphopantetheinyl transferase family protein [Oxalobacteraceae bacterium A2-2]
MSRLQPSGELVVWPWPGMLPAPQRGVFVIAVRTDGHTRRDRARLLVREAVREVLGSLLGIASSSVKIQSTPGEPPRILILSTRDVPPAPGCSFTHEAGLSLAAVNLYGPVGVDLMKVQDSPDWHRVARDYLGPEMEQELLACPPERRMQTYAQAWTANEARLKCLGRQLAEWDAGAAAPSAPLELRTLRLDPGLAGSLVLPAQRRL